MGLVFEADKLGAAVRAQRGPDGLRVAAAAAGVSPATMMRIERGHTPDVRVLLLLCSWLGRHPMDFISPQPCSK